MTVWVLTEVYRASYEPDQCVVLGVYSSARLAGDAGLKAAEAKFPNTEMQVEFDLEFEISELRIGAHAWAVEPFEVDA